jgi:hypothetical protein
MQSGIYVHRQLLNEQNGYQHCKFIKYYLSMIVVVDQMIICFQTDAGYGSQIDLYRNGSLMSLASSMSHNSSCSISKVSWSSLAITFVDRHLKHCCARNLPNWKHSEISSADKWTIYKCILMQQRSVAAMNIDDIIRTMVVCVATDYVACKLF